MIPKIIHYCWFGGNPLPELAQRCIASWRKYLPDFQILEWNEDNFDVNIIPYTAEAYRQKKYAFVSDYARFWILYKYGGIYFDTDVEVMRPMDDIISKGNFMGFEMDPDGENTPGKFAPRYCFSVALGLGFGMTKKHPFLQRMMDYYSNLNFDISTLTPWSKTIVAHTTEVLVQMGLQNRRGIQQVADITIYPHEYFAPINVISSRLHITGNTYTIHWYMGSWDRNDVNVNENDNKKISLGYLKKRLRNALPEWVFFVVNRIKRRKYRIR